MGLHYVAIYSLLMEYTYFVVFSVDHTLHGPTVCNNTVVTDRLISSLEDIRGIEKSQTDSELFYRACILTNFTLIKVKQL